MQSSARSGLERLRQLEEVWWETKDPVWGLPTGFQRLDELTGGLHPGETTVIGARPSVGKSSLISQIAFSVVMHIMEESAGQDDYTGRVVYFSPEMGYTDLFLRQAAQISNVPSMLVKSGRQTEQQRSVVHDTFDILDAFLDVLDVRAEGRLDISDVVSRVTTLNRQGPKVKLVLIDYLTRLTAGVGVNDDRVKANIISRELKDLALAEEVPIIIGAQLSRNGARQGSEDDPTSSYPRLTDLRASGQIEEDADNVWFIHRENHFINSKETETQPATLIIAKSRNGPTSVVPFLYEPHLTRFSEAEKAPAAPAVVKNRDGLMSLESVLTNALLFRSPEADESLPWP